MNNGYTQNPNILNDVAAQQQLLQQQMAQQMMYAQQQQQHQPQNQMNLPAQMQTYQQTPQPNTPMAPIAEEIDLSEIARSVAPPPPIQTARGPIPAQMVTQLPPQQQAPQTTRQALIIAQSAQSKKVPMYVIEPLILLLVFMIVLHPKSSYPLNDYLPALFDGKDITFTGLALRGVIVAAAFMLIKFLVNYFY